MTNELSVAGLFAGIGGLELGLQASGFRSELLCEINTSAQRVLRERFPDVDISPDVTMLESLPEVAVVAAGFPCQDLSQAGGKVGIAGSQSGLVGHLLRLVDKAKKRPKWIVIENVSYMLRLNQGHAMRYLTLALEQLGYRWAYRVVDARSFGVPQRRLRVILVASHDEDPRDVLFADNVSDSAIISNRLQAPLVIDTFGPNKIDWSNKRSYGFYWTEGRIGIGWTTDAVPTIKGGSGLGIPSPPAIWVPATNLLGMPTIEDGERLQGFPVGWTSSATERVRSEGIRWKLLGNAVCVPMAEWVGRRLRSPGKYLPEREKEFTTGSWPLAAYGENGKIKSVDLTVWPLLGSGQLLSEFLTQPLKPLSIRASAGFLARARLTDKINYSPDFLTSIQDYIHGIQNLETA
jgi:DNA (cytosine-5)-methyltransferase 1